MNKNKIAEAVRFADALKARYIIFHSGTNGMKNEVVTQLTPFADERFVIENKPIRGLDGSTCVGSIYGDLVCLESEKKARENARRSLVAAKDIKKGEKITADMLTWKRPGTGINADRYSEVLGKTAAVDIAEDTVLQEEMFLI